LNKAYCAITDALSSGTVSGLVPVAASFFNRRPGWMAQDTFEHDFKMCLWESMGLSLDKEIERIYGERLRNYPSDDMDSAIDELFEAAQGFIWGPLATATENSFGLCLEEDFSTFFYHYLSLVLIGDIDGVKRLKALMEVLPHAIPLGTKKDESGTWLVLCPTRLT
jgi:hypothetical protein